MKLAIEHLPIFAAEGTRLSIEKANTRWSDLTVAEVEKLTKLWFYESVLETQQPPEKSPLFLTRLEACEVLNITLPTLDKLAKKGIIKYHSFGSKRVFLQEDLASALMESNKLKSNEDE